MLDFNQIESDTKTGDFELIPDKTIAYAVMQLQGGDTEIPEFGRGNFFLKSQHSKAKWLPLEFTIIGGDYDGRKVWHRLFVDGDKLNEKNVPVAKDIGLKLMRAIIESARGIDSNDMSPEAQRAYRTFGPIYNNLKERVSDEIKNEYKLLDELHKFRTRNSKTEISRS